MKNKINKFSAIVLATVVLTLFIVSNSKVKAEEIQYEIYGENGEFVYPDNTKCDVLDTTNRIVHEKNRGITFYEMCLGSFPKYASTKVEEGLQPVYYAKYYFYPDPMPIYKDVSNGETDKLGKKTAKETFTPGNKVDGLAFKVTPDLTFEKLDEPSFRNIYYLYPHNETHTKNAVESGVEDNSFIRGPYQIGYNSYYHNAYRSRSFAYSVDFDFKIYEPYAGITTDGYPDSKLLFEGKIVYELDNACYDPNYLVYSDDCSEIEFYFPKGKVIDKSAENKEKATSEGEMKNIFIEDSIVSVGNETNSVPTDRVHYRNPGVHRIALKATEHLDLRLQQDIGTEYQTKGNKDSVQGVDAVDDTVYYFIRKEKDIFGNSIVPKNNINRVLTEVYREGNGTNPAGEMSTYNGQLAVSAESISNHPSNYAITNLGANGHYTYEPFVTFLNYCTSNTDAFGDASDARKPYTGTSYILSLEEQKESNCYHNHGRENHFWQYAWSKTNWYNKKLQ